MGLRKAGQCEICGGSGWIGLNFWLKSFRQGKGDGPEPPRMSR
jgi:hypothetical protein